MRSTCAPKFRIWPAHTLVHVHTRVPCTSRSSRYTIRNIYVLYGLYMTVYTKSTLSLSSGTYTGSHQPGPTRARICVKYYAGKQKPLEMQMFAASAIRIPGERRSCGKSPTVPRFARLSKKQKKKCDSIRKSVTANRKPSGTFQ